MQYLLATKNKAKIRRYGTKLIENGIDLLTLADLNIDIDIDESGNSPAQNALIKATEYSKLTKIPTIALDEGLFLDNVPEEVQPGTHVRRINGKRLNDIEMIEYYTSLVDKYGSNGELTGYFIKAVAIVCSNDTYTFEYKSDRKFTNRQSKIIDEGYPLASIQFIDSLGKFKSELTKDEEEKIVNVERTQIAKFIIDTIKMIENKGTEVCKNGK